MARGVAKWVVALAVALVGCAPDAGPTTPRPGRSSGPLVTTANPSPSPGAASPGPIASQDPGSTPALADLRGRVLLPDGKPAVGVSVRAMLITDNGAGLLGNNAAGLVGAGGGLITDNGAGLLGNNAGAYRLQGLHPVVRRLMQEGQSATTDAEGRYRLDLPATGSYNLESGLTDNSLKAIAQAATQASGAVTLHLATPGKLSIGVKAEQGAVTDYTGVQIFIPGTAYNGLTGSSGQVAFDSLPPGKFTFIAMSNRLGKGILGEVEVASGQLRTESRPIVLKRPPVKLLAIEPQVFMAGDKVTLRGEAFGKDAGSLVKATLAGRALSGLSVESNTTISFTAPANAESGGVVVDVDGFSSNELQAQVANNLEVVAPRQIEVGQTVALQGAAINAQQDKLATAPLAFRLAEGGTVAEVNASGSVTAKAVGQAKIEVALSTMKLQVPISVVAAGTLTGKAGQTHALVANLTTMALDAGRSRLLLGNPNNLLAYPLGGGTPTLVAGASVSSSSGGGRVRDGLGDAALIGDLVGLTCKADGTALFHDGGTLLRQVSPAGAVSLVAGHEDGDAFAAGSGVGATLGYTDAGLALFGDGSALFTTDDGFLVKVDPTGQASRFVTTPAFSESNVYVAASGHDGSAWMMTESALHQITAAGVRTRVANATTTGWSGFFDGSPKALAVAASGAIWALSDQGCLMHRPAGATSWQEVLAGDGGGQDAADGALGPSGPGHLGEVTAMAADADGRLWLLTEGKLVRIATPLSNPSLESVLRPGLPLTVHRFKVKQSDATE